MTCQANALEEAAKALFGIMREHKKGWGEVPEEARQAWREIADQTVSAYISNRTCGGKE